MKNTPSPVRILYIEDDPLLCDLFATVMEGEGYSVETALMGRDGLDRHKKNPFDMVAVDFELPDMIGLEIAGEMLADNPDLPITFLTGKGNEKIAAKALELGVMNYIIKGDESVYLDLLPTVIKNLNSKRIERVKRRESEVEIRKTAEYLKAVISNTADGMVSMDHLGIVETFNPAAEKMFGYCADEVIGNDVSLLMPMDARATHSGYLQQSDLYAPRIINKGRELKGQRKDGSLFSMELSVSPMSVEGRSMFVGIMRDITERKQIVNQLRISETRLQKSQFFANIGTWDWNIENGELYWSERVAPLFGYATDEVEPSYELAMSAIHADDRNDVSEAMEACIEGGEIFDNEHRVVWPDGTVRWLHERGDVIRDDEGSPLNLLGVVHDITDRIHTEDAIRQAKEAADRANMAKSEFLSSMSHELRTPMNAILGFGQMLDFNPKEPLTVAQKDCVNHILKGGQHLLELINEILDLAQIESGKVVLSIENISPIEVCNECLSLLKTLADERDIDISVPDHNIAIPMVRADFTRLRQIFLNLLSNAIKYNRQNGSIIIDFVENLSGRLRISITDTGNGIPQNRQAELFQAFSRLGAENTEIEGTGIGLIVCKQLVERMAGEISFESTVGKGSTFWFDLPICDVAANHVNSGIASISDPAAVLPGAKGLLLYVEDNPANLRLMELIVERVPGLSMISAHNGELGMELARTHRPDIVILDINLPGMDGFEALKQLRTMPETRDVPVLALSAAATSRDVDKGVKAGFRRYLTKPMKIDEIVKAIKAVISEVKG